MRDDIVTIDAPLSGSTNTLRQAIMSIPTTTGNTSTPLVFSIDRRWKQPGYMFSFHPDKLEEGRRTVKGLILILIHKLGEEPIKPFFTPRALLEGKDLLFDPITGAISFIADRDLASIFDDDDEMSTIQLLVPAGHQDTAQISGQRMTSALTKERADDDTISTMRNGQSGSNLLGHAAALLPNEINAKSPKLPPDSRSTGSDYTTSSLSFTTKHTMITRMSTIKSSFGNMKSQLDAITAFMKAALQGSAVPSAPPLHVTYPTHGSPDPSNSASPGHTGLASASSDVPGKG
jgi:hypothetical protein